MTPETLYVEIRIVYTKTEQEFLGLAIQAASKKYRELRPSSSQQTRSESISLKKASVERNRSATDCRS